MELCEVGTFVNLRLPCVDHVYYRDTFVVMGIVGPTGRLFICNEKKPSYTIPIKDLEQKTLAVKDFIEWQNGVK